MIYAANYIYDTIGMSPDKVETCQTWVRVRETSSVEMERLSVPTVGVAIGSKKTPSDKGVQPGVSYGQ
jgi:hypothetical protein